MLDPIRILRMARWARHPPSWRRVRLVAAVLVLCLLVYGFERAFGWPEWLTVGGRPGIRVR